MWKIRPSDQASIPTMKRAYIICKIPAPWRRLRCWRPGLAIAYWIFVRRQAAKAHRLQPSLELTAFCLPTKSILSAADSFLRI